MEQQRIDYSNSEVAAKGRDGDVYMAHVAPGERIVPPVISPELQARLDDEMRAAGLDPSMYTVGNGMSINPDSGHPEFGFFKKAFKSITKFIGKVTSSPLGKIALVAAGGYGLAASGILGATAQAAVGAGASAASGAAGAAASAAGGTAATAGTAAASTAATAAGAAGTAAATGGGLMSTLSTVGQAAQALSAVNTVGGLLSGDAGDYSISSSQAGGTAAELAASASEAATEEERRKRRGSQANINTSQLGLLNEGQTAASALLG